jgi:hypothetical protein
VAAAPPPGRPGERAPGLDGCPFFARCGIRLPGTCDRVPPPVVTIASGHTARCHRTTP